MAVSGNGHTHRQGMVSSRAVPEPSTGTPASGALQGGEESTEVWQPWLGSSLQRDLL